MHLPAESLELLRLYAKLRPGLTISEWMEENEVHHLGIDVRRLITFGVIKGFLRRSHCYPIWLDHPALVTPDSIKPSIPGPEVTPRAKRKTRYPTALPNLLDGRRHTDELGLRFNASFGQLLAHFRAIGTQRHDLVDFGSKGLGRVQLVYL